MLVYLEEKTSLKNLNDLEKNTASVLKLGSNMCSKHSAATSLHRKKAEQIKAANFSVISG